MGRSSDYLIDLYFEQFQAEDECKSALVSRGLEVSPSRCRGRTHPLALPRERRQPTWYRASPVTASNFGTPAIYSRTATAPDRRYRSADEVAAVFGVDSPEHRMAVEILSCGALEIAVLQRVAA